VGYPHWKVLKKDWETEHKTTQDRFESDSLAPGKQNISFKKTRKTFTRIDNVSKKSLTAFAFLMFLQFFS